jgi:hypothetical protein
MATLSSAYRDGRGENFKRHERMRKASLAPLTVDLSSVGNPDYAQDPDRPLPGVPVESLGVRDFAEASRVCREYIAAHNLGGGNWSGGRITDRKGVEVGRVSYNGKVWGPGEWTPGTTPLYVPGASPAAVVREGGAS